MRERNSGDALLKVTGRDVREAEYAVKFSEGRWTLAGGSLRKAEMAAGKRRQVASLGDRSAAVVEAVEGMAAPVRAADVASAVGISQQSAKLCLSRLGFGSDHPSPTRRVRTWDTTHG